MNKRDSIPGIFSDIQWGEEYQKIKQSGQMGPMSYQSGGIVMEFQYLKVIMYRYGQYSVKLLSCHQVTVKGTYAYHAYGLVTASQI